MAGRGLRAPPGRHLGARGAAPSRGRRRPDRVPSRRGGRAAAPLVEPVPGLVRADRDAVDPNRDAVQRDGRPLRLARLGGRGRRRVVPVLREPGDRVVVVGRRRDGARRDRRGVAGATPARPRAACSRRSRNGASRCGCEHRDRRTRRGTRGQIRSAHAGGRSRSSLVPLLLFALLLASGLGRDPARATERARGRGRTRVRRCRGSTTRARSISPTSTDRWSSSTSGRRGACRAARSTRR